MYQHSTIGRSLSARRAWIEILVHRAARAMLGGMSLSARRAWIEILDTLVTTHAILSLSARRAWIEIAGQPAHGLPSMSLSARRAWIEISEEPYTRWFGPVALRKESVDRNM